MKDKSNDTPPPQSQMVASCPMIEAGLKAMLDYGDASESIVRDIINAALRSAVPPATDQMVATGEPVSPPEFALQMNEYAAFVAKQAPRLHWKVWHANRDDRSLYEGGFDGWRHGFGMVQLEAAPLPDLMREMRSSLLAKLEDRP